MKTFAPVLLIFILCGYINAQVPKAVLDQKLVVACLRSDVTEVKSLLAQGASANARDLFGQPVILLALISSKKISFIEKRQEIIDLFLKHGANINDKNRFGTTPYLKAQDEMQSHVESLKKQEEELNKWFLARGADPNVKDIFGGGIWDYKEFGSDDYYPSRWVDGKETGNKLDRSVALWRIVLEGQMNLLEFDMPFTENEFGANQIMAAAYYYNAVKNVNYTHDAYKKTDSIGSNILTYAALGDCWDCMNGVNPEDKDFVSKQNADGATALSIAAQLDHLMIVKKLLRLGADTNLKDSLGNTAIFYAAEYDYHVTILDLLTGGADVNLFNKDGLTPLMLAAKLGNTNAVAAFLMAKKVGQRAASDYRRTKKKTDKLLAERFRRINIDLKNSQGETAYSLAVKNKRTEIVELIRPFVSNFAGVKKSTSRSK